jgi:5-methylcytosine-specific restriction endonuclease McrA
VIHYHHCHFKQKTLGSSYPDELVNSIRYSSAFVKKKNGEEMENIMGVITKEVEVTLNNNTFRYYENLGYKIPRYKDKRDKLKIKRNTKIMVKVDDLPKGAIVLVDVQCDCCKKVKKLMYSDYRKTNHDGLCYCKDCEGKVLRSGENSHFWNKNKIDEEREMQRRYVEYKEFVKKVLSRDNYTCQCCGSKVSGDANVHHLDGYNWCIEKRTDETNGITLCENCHKNFHSIYGRGYNTKEQYEEWIGYALNELKKYNGILPTARKVYCFEEDKVYESAVILSEEWNVNSSQVYHVCNNIKGCNSVHGKHLIWYDIYINNTVEENKMYVKNKKRRNQKEVICLETNEIFDSITSANKKYDIDLWAYFKSKKKNNGGILTDGTKLHWIYYEDYIKLYGELNLEELAS